MVDSILRKLSVFIPILLTIVLALSIIGNASAQPSVGDYIVANYGINELSKVTPDGTVTTIASSGPGGPHGVAIDSSGNYIVTEIGSDELSKVTPGGTVTLIASSGLFYPRGVAIVPEPTTHPVGGIYAPINKLNILAPYFALVSLIGAISMIFAIRRWYRD